MLPNTSAAHNLVGFAASRGNDRRMPIVKATDGRKHQFAERSPGRTLESAMAAYLLLEQCLHLSAYAVRRLFRVSDDVVPRERLVLSNVATQLQMMRKAKW